MKEGSDVFDKEWLKETHEKINGSAVFLSLFSDNYIEDPLALIQLLYAMMLEKPIYIVAQKGDKIPKAFMKIADKIEYYENRDGVKDAVTRCLKDEMI